MTNESLFEIDPEMHGSVSGIEHVTKKSDIEHVLNESFSESNMC